MGVSFTDEGALLDRFRGCLLGQAVADALGGLFEAQSPEAIRQRFGSVAALMDYPRDELWYTDDTQMMIGVAECLVERGRIEEGALCKAFVANYVPSRGYGRGARAVLEAMEEGQDHKGVAERYFPGGSYGNGAAMRVAPVGLFFRDDPGRLKEEARLSALPTHLHPLGIEGAVLLARGVALASGMESFDRDYFFDSLRECCSSEEFRAKIDQAARVRSVEALAGLGNGIEALESVATALASFALEPRSYAETVGNLIFLGGDTDTLAAMGGALSGAFVGASGLPARLVGLLEDGPQGRAYLEKLARQLVEGYRRGAG